MDVLEMEDLMKATDAELYREYTSTRQRLADATIDVMREISVVHPHDRMTGELSEKFRQYGAICTEYWRTVWLARRWYAATTAKITRGPPQNSDAS